METKDKDTLAELMNSYSIKDIVQCLSELSHLQADRMSDMQLPEAAKEWSERSFVLITISDMLR